MGIRVRRVARAFAALMTERRGRDMLALADQASSAPQYFGSVQEAVNTVRPGQSGLSGKED